jgi:hypothetical protein
VATSRESNPWGPPFKSDRVSFNGHIIGRTGSETLGSQSELEQDATIYSLLESQYTLTMTADTLGKGFIGLDLNEERSRGKCRIIPIGKTHEVHLHTVEFMQDIPKHQLIICIFDVKQDKNIGKTWTVNLEGPAAYRDEEVRTVHIWATQFDSSVDAMSAGLNRMLLWTADGRTWKEFLVRVVAGDMVPPSESEPESESVSASASDEESDSESVSA